MARIVRFIPTERDAALLRDLRQRYPTLTTSALLRWGLAALASAAVAVPLPPQPRRGPKPRTVRSEAAAE